MSRTLKIVRSISAPIAGYAVIVLGTTISFKLAHGINLHSPLPNLVFGTLGILASGLLGGFVAGWVAARRPVIHATAVLIFLVMDSITVLFFRHHHEPLWFGLMSASGLMLATICGGVARGLFERRLMRPAKAEATQ